MGFSSRYFNGGSGWVDIVQQLYNDYYVENKTPSNVCSSYWKFWQTKSEVKMENGVVTRFQGVAFGDLQTKSFVNNIFSQLTIYAHLWKLPNSKKLKNLVLQGKLLSKQMGFNFNFDSFRQICSYALIIKYLTKKNPRILIIGDGYGYLSAFFKQMLPESKICLVDLGKTLFFQAYDLQKAFPRAGHLLASPQKVTAEMSNKNDFIYCPTQDLSMIDGLTFDLAINICSMQEMNQETIERYFRFMRTHLVEDNLFYCCNRLEKIMPGGEVAQLYSFPWDAEDVCHIDEPCFWCQFFFASFSTARGPRLFNAVRIPFVNYYDGPINHRLVKMAIKNKKVISHEPSRIFKS